MLPLASFVAGVSVGLAVAVPIGPMGVLCIQRTLSLGLIGGLATGLGAATVHLAYGLVAALGLGTAATAWIGVGTQGLALISAGLLFWFAAKLLSCSRPIAPNLRAPDNWFGSFASAIVFGLSNPLTILLFVAAIPALTAVHDLKAVPAFITGVFLGSAVWWTILSAAIALIRGRLSDGVLTLTNKASGLVFAALGVMLLANAFR